MIENEALSRESRYQLSCDTKMFGINQEVVGQIASFQQGNPAEERRTQHELVVQLGLHDMPHTDELWSVDEWLELFRGVRSLQIDPANDARNERVLGGHVEKPSGFGECLSRLYRNTRINPREIHVTPHVARQKITTQRCHRIVDPAVLGGAVAPEMLMGVYSHTRTGRWVQTFGMGVPPAALDW